MYREAKIPGMEHTEGTETFNKILNDLFEAFNVKLPAQGTWLETNVGYVPSKLYCMEILTIQLSAAKTYLLLCSGHF